MAFSSLLEEGRFSPSEVKKSAAFRRKFKDFCKEERAGKRMREAKVKERAKRKRKIASFTKIHVPPPATEDLKRSME